MKKKLVKKKKKGFTLIELLAVILILGIIALIAIPTVNGVIAQSRRGAAEASAKQFIKSVDEYVVLSELSGEILADGLYSVSDLLELDLGIKGDVPTDGYVYILNNEVVESVFEVGNHSVSYIGGEYNASKERKSYDYGYEVLYNPTTGKKCDGEAVNSSVGNTQGCLRWYVLSQDDFMVNLILDHNIINYLPWNSGGSNLHGPSSEFMNTLKNLTDSWNSVPTRNDSYSFKSATKATNYTISYAGYKARIPSANEIARAIGKDSFDETRNSSEIQFKEDLNEHYVVHKTYWLYDRIYSCTYYGCMNNDKDTYGYWLSTANAVNETHALSVEWEGCIRYYRLASTSDREGIRPVITLLKSSIE